jgi:hypothetical protein
VLVVDRISTTFSPIPRLQRCRGVTFSCQSPNQLQYGSVVIFDFTLARPPFLFNSASVPVLLQVLPPVFPQATH